MDDIVMGWRDAAKRLRAVAQDLDRRASIEEIHRTLDAHNVSDTATHRVVWAVLRAAGVRFDKNLCGEVLKQRRTQNVAVIQLDLGSGQIQDNADQQERGE